MKRRNHTPPHELLVFFWAQSREHCLVCPATRQEGPYMCLILLAFGAAGLDSCWPSLPEMVSYGA